MTAVSMAATFLLALGSLAHAGRLVQDAGGLSIHLTSHPETPRRNAETRYVLRIMDTAGSPVRGAQVVLRGAMADGMSVVAPLRTAVQPGEYHGRVLFTMEGQWQLTLRVTRDGRSLELPLTETVGR